MPIILENQGYPAKGGNHYPRRFLYYWLIMEIRLEFQTTSRTGTKSSGQDLIRTLWFRTRGERVGYTHHISIHWDPSSPSHVLCIELIIQHCYNKREISSATIDDDKDGTYKLVTGSTNSVLRYTRVSLFILGCHRGA